MAAKDDLLDVPPAEDEQEEPSTPEEAMALLVAAAKFTRPGRDLVRDTALETAREVGELPGALAFGLIKGAYQGGMKDVAAFGDAVMQAIPKVVVPGSDEQKVVGSGVAWLATHPVEAGKAAWQFSKDEVKRIGKVADDPIGMAKEDPLGTLDALSMLALPSMMATRMVLKKIGIHVTKKLMEETSRLASRNLGKGAMDFKDNLAKAGVEISEADAIWAITQSDEGVNLLQRASGGTTKIGDVAPMPHGMEKKWIKEAGGSGQQAYAEFRNGRNIENLLKRLISEESKRTWKGLSKDAKSGISVVANIVDLVDGKLRYGGVLRAGQLDAKLVKSGLLKEGDLFVSQVEFEALTEKGFSVSDIRDMANARKSIGDRIIGPEIPDSDGRRQLYRVIHADEAKAAHAKFIKEHPRAAKVLDEFLAAKETPIVTAQGLVLPGKSRKRLKQQYNIEGLEQSEADHMSHLFRAAFGAKAFPDHQLWQFNWIPEAAEHSDSLSARIRNGLMSWSSPTRRGKTGLISEAVRESGQGIDLQRGLTHAQTSLAIEDVRNATTRSILSQVARPLTAAEREIIRNSREGLPNFKGTSLEGWSVMSKTGLFGETERAGKFFSRNKKWFEEQGIDVPESLQALKLAGGKGFAVPSKIADNIGGWYKPELLSTNPVANKMRNAVDKAFGDLIRAPLTFWLSRPSTANRNFVSQTFTFAPKVIRDFYEGLYRTIGDERFETIQWQNFQSNFTAMGKMHGKKLRGEMPPEMLGSNFLQQLEVGPLSKLAAKPLRLFGFNYHDVSFKRLVVESVYDAQSKASWHTAVREGSTGGMSKTEYIRRWRAGVPKEIEALAWREMDTWGAFDYDNVPSIIDAIRQGSWFRAFIPYPTYIYKLWANTYTELGLTPQGFWHNAKKAWSGTRAERNRALANMSAGATMAGIAWKVADEVGNLAKELRNEQTRELALETEELSGKELSEADLVPAQQRKFGRKQLPEFAGRNLEEFIGLAEDESLWVRQYDLPFIGEAMAYKGIMGKDATFQDFMNDRVALGPLWTALLIATNQSDDYNRNLSRGARLGKLAANLTPLGNELEVIRKMTDTEKKDLRDKDGGFFADFFKGYANRFPGLSQMVEPRLVGQRVQHYNRGETLGAYFTLNVRKLGQEEREAAISSLAIMQAGEMRKEINENIYRENFMKIVDASGKTPAGEAFIAVGGSDAEVQRSLRMSLNATKIAQAFNFGGADAALVKAEQLVEEQEEAGTFDEGMGSSILSELRKWDVLGDEGVPGFLRSRLPKRLQDQFDEKLSELEQQ